MAYGNYNPQTQAASQVAGSQPKTATTQARTGQVQSTASTTGSPVTPTGQISQAPAPAPAPQAPAPTGQVAPGVTTDPFASMGGGVQLPTGGWVPKGHPLAQQQQAQAGQQAPGAANPYDYPGKQSGNFYQWGGSPVMDATQSAVLNALQNPLFGSEQIAAMKGSAKDASAQMQQQLESRVAQDAASRGTYGSGQMDANDRKIRTGMASNLLGQYRDTDLATTQANRSDLYTAIGAGQNFTGLNEGLNQAAVQSALQNRGYDIQSQLGNRGIDAQLQGYRMNLAGDMIGGLLGYQNSLNNVGLGYSQLDAQQQNALLQRLLGGF